MTCRAFRTWATVWIVAACAALPACSSESREGTFQQGVTTGAGVVVEFRSLTNPPATGMGTYEVAVRQNGAPLDGAVVRVRFTMPAMPSMNMPEMHSDATFEGVGGGRYRGAGQLTMAGTWNVNVSVSRGAEEIGTSRLSIVAKD